MRVQKESTTLDWGCGVTVVGNFKRADHYVTWNLVSNVHSYTSGTGFFISSFINSPVCREAYNQIKENFEITYQSPVTLNENSNNRFFFIVYRKKK